jgi:hypothetical protein
MSNADTKQYAEPSAAAHMAAVAALLEATVPAPPAAEPAGSLGPPILARRVVRIANKFFWRRNHGPS